MRKVVTSQEMARIEQFAVQHGGSVEAFMQEAGKKVAVAAASLLQKRNGTRVVLLIGRGNKGGDAYVAGIELLQAGFSVRAISFYAASECSELNRHFAKQFSGKTNNDASFAQDDLIIDGLLGTGFHGSTDISPFGTIIELANQSGKPILAIDIPSGLDGTTGACRGPAIIATETVTLGFAKIGLFKGSGWNCTGKLRIEDFGLSQIAIDEAKAVALIPRIEELHLPPMARSHHKYERGFVVGFGGSKELKGAVKLSGAAALHAGAGIVKLFTLEDVGPMADELIAQIWNLAAWKEALEKASAVFIGPGLGRSEAAKEGCKAALHKIDKPCVVDADALFFLPELKVPKACVLTPHRGEALRLLGMEEMDEEQLFGKCQAYVDEHGVVFILKGAPTYIFSAGHLPVIIPLGDPGMATAGSGDVLTGIVAALLAQGQSALEASVLGVTLHALAGEAAALEKTSYGYSASDLIEYLPSAFKRFS
jgi:NAD(P)H-hydrate epimerase